MATKPTKKGTRARANGKRTPAGEGEERSALERIFEEAKDERERSLVVATMFALESKGPAWGTTTDRAGLDLRGFNLPLLAQSLEDIDAALSDARPLARATRMLLIACADFAAARVEGMSPSETDDVPERARAVALRLLPQIAALAVGEQAPRADLASADRLVTAVLSLERRQAESWQEGMVRAFEVLAERDVGGYPVGPKADITAIAIVTDEIGKHVGYGVIPPILHYGPGRPRLPKAEAALKLQSGLRALRKIRLAAPGERTGGRSKRVSPFTAARDFAHALGLPFPERERDFRRPTKSGRRVSTRTDGSSID